MSPSHPLIPHIVPNTRSEVKTSASIWNFNFELRTREFYDEHRNLIAVFKDEGNNNCVPISIDGYQPYFNPEKPKI